MTDQNVEKILKYSRSLLGVPYKWWLEGESTSDVLHPFYVNKLPSKSYLQKHGINCTGFINLLRLKLGKDIKGKGKYKGGTYQWYKYFKDNKLLRDFDYNVKYPLGTLFIRNYRNKNDQGHVAVLYSYNKKRNLKDKVLYGNIIHAWSDGEYPTGKGEIGITNLGQSYFFIADGYYDNIIFPKDWFK